MKFIIIFSYDFFKENSIPILTKFNFSIKKKKVFIKLYYPKFIFKDVRLTRFQRELKTEIAPLLLKLLFL